MNHKIPIFLLFILASTSIASASSQLCSDPICFVNDTVIGDFTGQQGNPDLNYAGATVLYIARDNSSPFFYGEFRNAIYQLEYYDLLRYNLSSVEIRVRDQQATGSSVEQDIILYDLDDSIFINIGPKFYYTGDWSTPANLDDQNLATGTSVGIDETANAYWEFRGDYSSNPNVTLVDSSGTWVETMPADCQVNPTIRVEVSKADFGLVNWYCKNQSNWYLLRGTTGFTTAFGIEMGIGRVTWNNSPCRDTGLNLNCSQDSNTTHTPSAAATPYDSIDITSFFEGDTTGTKNILIGLTADRGSSVVDWDSLEGDNPPTIGITYAEEWDWIQNLTVIEAGSDLNCSFDYAGYRGANLTSTNYTWFVNSVEASSQQVLSDGNFTTNDEVVCQVDISDELGTLSENSSTYVVGDATPPTVENGTKPSSVVQNAAGTFTVDVTDDGVIADVYVSWIDPNSVSSGNLSMNAGSANSYTRSFTFTTIGTYTSVTYYAVDGNGNAASQVLTGNFTVTTTPPAGGGGGGGTPLPEPDDATITAQPSEVYISSFNNRGELVVTNNEASTNTYTVRVKSSSEELTGRISFAGFSEATLTVDGQGSLSGNKKFVTYEVAREELEEGSYQLAFELRSDSGIIVDEVTVTIIKSDSALDAFFGAITTNLIPGLSGGTAILLLGTTVLGAIVIFRTPPARATARRRGDKS